MNCPHSMWTALRFWLLGIAIGDLVCAGPIPMTIRMPSLLIAFGLTITHVVGWRRDCEAWNRDLRDYLSKVLGWTEGQRSHEDLPEGVRPK